MMSTNSHHIHSLPRLALIILFSLIQFASAGCYWEDGTDRNAAANKTNNYQLTSDPYVPCPPSPGATASMCCSTNDQCQPNGLCWNPGFAVYWRESCTDRSWESTGCIKLFINGTGASDDIVVTECGDGSFCFLDKNFDCCSAGDSVYIVDGEQKPHDFNATTSSSATTSPTSTPVTSSAPAATTTGSGNTNPSPNPGLSTGAKAGIGVGVALGALVVLGGLAWFLMRRRRQGRNNAAAAPSYNDGQTPTGPAEKGADSAYPPKRPLMPQEADSDQYVHRAEMPTQQNAAYRDGMAELGDTQRR